MLGNDREGDKKSGLEARKILCYARRIINCREKGQRFKKKRRRRKDTTNGRKMI